MAKPESLSPARERVSLPFRAPLVEADVVFLKKAPTTQNGSRAAGEFYFLALRKILKGVHGTLTDACRREYEARAPFYAILLAGEISSASFDAVVCVPTSNVEVQTPYLDAFMLKNPKAIDLSSKFRRDEGSDSTSGKTWDERRQQIEFDATDIGAPERILVIDDVLHSGYSASLVMDVLQSSLGSHQLQFTLACPLWMA